MKQILFMLFLTFGIFESLNGQVEVGVAAGLNISSCKISAFGLVNTPRKGYFVGISPSYEINQKIQLVFDLQYSQKGYILEVTDLTNSEYRYSYLEMISEIEYKPVENLIFGLGISGAYRINEENKEGSADWVSTRDWEFIKSSDFGITGKIKGVYKNIFGFVRYNIGLKDISNLEFSNSVGDVALLSLYNRNIQFGLGYIFDWEKE